MLGCGRIIDNGLPTGNQIDFADLMQSSSIKYEKGNDTPFTGTAVRTYEDGRKALTEFMNGKGNGQSILWHANGKKAMQVTLVDDNPHGVLIKWNDKGNEISRSEYINGIQVSPGIK